MTESDVQSIQARFATPIVIQYFAGDELPRKACGVKFSFITMNQNGHVLFFWEEVPVSIEVFFYFFYVMLTEKTEYTMVVKCILCI